MIVRILTTNGNHAADISKDNFIRKLKGFGTWFLSKVIIISKKVIEISEKGIELLKELPEEIEIDL